MIRTAILFTATSFLGAALACGEGKCTMANCSMPATSAAATDVTTADGTKGSMQITGMTCGSCADKIHAKLLEIEGVNAATIDQPTGKADVAFDATKTDMDAMLAAVNGMGHFTATATN